MRLIAKFVKSLDRVEGETDRGAWVRGGMVVRTIGDNERLVALTTLGEDKTKLAQSFKTDDIVEVDFVPESREFGEKWFTDLRLLSAKMLGQAATGTTDCSEKGGA